MVDQEIMSIGIPVTMPQTIKCVHRQGDFEIEDFKWKGVYSVINNRFPAFDVAIYSVVSNYASTGYFMILSTPTT